MPYIPVSYNPNPVYPENEGNPFATTPTSQPSTLWENVSASFDEGLRMNALSSAYYGGITFMTGQDWGSKRLSADEVTDQLDKRGLAGHLAVKNYGYTQKQLDILCEQKERELQNQDILARNDSSLVSAINFGTRIAAGLLDPTNHIPIGLINNAKYLKTLQSAGGFWSRNAARVAMSAINAGPGNVITESIVGPIQANVLQADYGVEDYFANIGIGSIAGGILGATTGRLGLISELRNSWSGTRQPWQIAMPTDRTIQLRDTWATQQAEAMLRANPTLNETAVRQNAQATAAVFDAYARTLAYDTKAQVEDIYARYAPEFRAGDTTASGGLNQSSIFDVAMESQGEIDPGFRAVEQQDFMRNLFGEDLDTPVTLREIQGYGENYLRDFAELFSDSLRNLDESGMDVEFSPRDILAGHRIGESSAPKNIRAASEASVPTAPEVIDYRIGADGNITEGVPQADPNRYQMITEAINEEGQFPRENQIKNDIRAEIGAAKDDKIFIHRKPGEEYYTVYRGDKNARGYKSAEEVAGLKVIAMDDSLELQNREKQYALLRDTQPDTLVPEQLTVRRYAEANKISVAEAARRLEAEGYAVPRGEAQANGRRGRVKATEPITGKVAPENQRVEMVSADSAATPRDDTSLVWNRLIERWDELQDADQGLRMEAARPLFSDLSREQLDQALIALQRSGEIVVYPYDQISRITPAAREAALTVNGRPLHVIYRTGKITPETRININRAVANAAEALAGELPVSREAIDVSGKILDIANERLGKAIDAAVRSAAPDAVHLANEIVRTGEVNLNAPELTRTVQAAGELVTTISNEVGAASNAIGTQVVRAANEVLPRLEAAVNEATRVTSGTPLLATAAEAVQQPPNIRARTRWNPDGKAVVDFFQTTDLTSAPHEMFHIFRRMVADAAEDPNAAGNVKSQWDAIRDFVGAKEGSPFPVEMEEKFARAGERYLLNGEAPNPKLNDVFTRMRQWFLEVYGNANEAGLKISPEMRRTFDDMLRLPPEAIEDGLRYSLEELQIRNPATEAGDVYDHTGEAGDDITETIKPDVVDADYQNAIVRAGEAGTAELDAELAPLRTELQRLTAEPEVARTIAEGIMAGRGLDEISMDLVDGVWTPEQINELYQAVLTGHQKGLSLQDILTRLQQTTDQKVRENLLQQRATILNKRARDAAQERIFTNFQGQEAEGVASLLAGSNLLREEGRLTADALASAKRNRYISGLVADIEKLPKTTQRMFLEDACELDLARALWSIDNPRGDYTGPSEVMDIAKAIHKWQEIARAGANDAGAYIGKLDGYIIHQTHNADRIREAGSEVWRDDIHQLLDWSRTADGRYETDMDGREQFLNGAYKDLSTGYHTHIDGTREPIMMRGTVIGSTASGASQPRTLHFKDADSWYQYNQKYGNSSIRESVASNLDHLANATGMMQILGPSPHSNLKRIVDVTLDRLRNEGRVDEMDKLQNSYKSGFIRNCMMELDGTMSHSANPRVSKPFQAARDLLSTAQLGSSLFSQFADLPNAAMEMHYQGHNYFTSLFSEMTNMGKYWGNNSQEMKQMWAGLGAYADDVLREHQSRWRVEDSASRGIMHKIENGFYRLAMMEHWDQTHRKGVATKMAYHLAQDSVKSWNELKPQMRRVFNLAGIDADRWEVIRHADKITVDGNTYLSPESVRNLPDGVIAQYLDARGQSSTPVDIRMARNDIADRLSSWFWDRNTYAVISPDVRTRAIMRQGQQAGTFFGEVARSIGQFKSFTISETQRTYAREIYGYGEDTFFGALRQRFSSFSGESGFMPMVNMMAVNTLYGMLALQSKELAKGRTLRDMRDPKTWIAAYAQSGGAGIYGDFLFGERSRFGGGPLTAMLGPLVNSADDLLDILQGIRDGDDVSSKLAAFAWRHTPGNNLWFTRAAMNQLVMYRIQEALKPGYLNRMEKRVGKQNDQNFLIRPSWNPWTDDWNWSTMQGRDYRQAQ